MNIRINRMAAAMSALLLTAAMPGGAEVPSGYYAGLEGKSGAALKKAAKAAARDHTVIEYGKDGTWQAFRKTDVHVVNGSECWWDMYSSDNIPVSAGAPPSGMNIEHSVANSWWGKTKNDAYKDLFHLNPSNSDANSRKGNYPLGECATVTWDNGVTFVGKPKSGQGGGNNYVYEPADEYKGDFARVFFYMFTIYDDISWKESTNWMYTAGSDLLLKPWAYELLLRWAENDPVSQKEIDRNEAIYGIQGNRNPFIDNPTLAEHIWGSLSSTPFHADEDPGTDPVPGPGDDPEPAGNSIECDFDKYPKIENYFSEGWLPMILSGDLSGWWIKDFQGNSYATCSSYQGNVDGGPYEMWLLTPEFEVPEGSKATLTFRSQGAYGCDGCEMKAYVLDGVDMESARELPARVCVPNPDGAKPVYSDWVESGEVDLSHYTGTRRVGFRYYAEAGGPGHSATYCIDDVKINVALPVTVSGFPISDGLYGAEGGIANPDGARVTVFDLSGRVAARGTETFIPLEKGIYVVVEEGGKPVKIMTR